MLLNIDDYRRAAERRLPRSLFEVIEGGAADEVTLRANRAAFDEISLRPRALADVTTRDLRTSVLGVDVSMPLLLDPCGFSRMAHREAELAVARAAGSAGVIMTLSTITSYPLEEVARVATGPMWFQLYPPADRGACRELIERARASGFSSLCVTIDGATAGLRERDRRNRIAIPVRVTPRLVAECARRPRWAIDYLRGGAGRGNQGFGDVRPQSIKQAGEAVLATARAITPEEIEFIRSAWDGPLVIKGVHRADEIDILVSLGADGLVVSNHGGRQLDTVLAAVEVLPEVVHAADGKVEVFVDGGFRRGVDVVKALALGARAVLIGRPWIYGLAVKGEEGVRRVIEIMRFEIDQTMTLLGCPTIADVDRSVVRLRPGFAGFRGSDEAVAPRFDG